MSNPLLNIQFRIPFDEIRAEDVEPAVAELIADARKNLEAIASAAGPRTYDNTLRAYDHMTDRLDFAMGVVRHLEAVATTPELRAAYNKVQPEVSAFYSSIPLHKGLWKAIESYAATGEARKLTGVRQRFVTKTIDYFKRHGAMLPPEQKAKLEEIDVEIAKLTTKFSENVLDSTNAFELVITEEDKLKGLPPTAREAAKESARAKGVDGWRFTLQAPSYLSVMTYLDDSGIREKMYRAFTTRAASGDLDNRAIAARILELRRERARLLGYQDFADLVIENRMAHTGARAQEFLDKLEGLTGDHFGRENQELLAFRRHVEGPDALALQPWDVGYYAEKQRAALYDFDEEALRPYFPLERVVTGMFEIFLRVFGIRVSERAGVPAWDSAVKFYDIHDAASSEHLGSFYADFYPRENKRGGAWMDSFITGGPIQSGFEPHLGLICGNLTPPVGGKPALLTHRDVETIFHEFGHLLHHCLSRVEVRGFAGTNVAWDFVELPSQIMENWCWDRESLDLFARHFETNEPIPEDLYQKMKRARTYRSANAQMRQLGFAFVDLALHRNEQAAFNGDITRYSRELIQRFSPTTLPPEHAMIAAFTHLFANPVGYGAGYYSYKWAEVLDADAFTRFQREGVFNPETGRAFRDQILAKGDSEEPDVLYRTFMGRDPDLSALLVRSGLTCPTP